MAIITKGTNLRIAGINPLAVEYADKLNDAFFQEADTALEALNHTRVASILIASHINDLFTHEEIIAMPVVDTNKKEDEKYEGNNPDYTIIMEGKKTTRVSFFDTMIDRSKWAVIAKSELEAVTDAISEKEGYDKKIKAKGPIFMAAEKKRLEQRLKDVKAMFRKGIKIVQQRARIEEELPGVGFEYWTNPVGEIIHSNTPIVLTCNGKAGVFEHVSIGSFNGLNVDAALATLDALDHEPTAHEQYEALIATKKKGADDEEEADPDNLEVNNMKRFETAAASMLYYIRKDNSVTKLYAKIDKTKDISEVADELLTLSGLAAEFADIAEHFAGKIEKARDYMAEKEKRTAA